jgi:hypothetical protein
MYYMIHSRIVDRCVEIAASSEVCNITIYICLENIISVDSNTEIFISDLHFMLVLQTLDIMTSYN